MEDSTVSETQPLIGITRILVWIGIVCFLGITIWRWFDIPSVGKFGVLLAIGATLMAPYWDRLGSVGKMLCVGTMFLMLGVEYRAINKDKADSEALLLSNFQQISNDAHSNLKSLLESENKQFKDVLDKQQNTFDATIKRMERDEKMQAHSFENVIGRENTLITGFQEIVSTEQLVQSKTQEIELEMRAEITLARAQNAPRPAAGPVQPIPLPPPETQDTQALRVQGLKVSKDIDDWIDKIAQEAPQFNASSMNREDVVKRNAYAERIGSEFASMFASQANTLVSNLHIHGLRLSCMGGSFSSDPNFMLSMHRNCATRIREAALDLK
jgi:hypothetical protein